MTKRPTQRKRLNLPLFSCAQQHRLLVKVTGEFRSDSMSGLSKNEDGTVRVLPVINLDTGEEGLLISLAVVESTLNRQPDGFVGRCYEIITGDMVPGKDYREVEIYEIDDPREED